MAFKDEARFYKIDGTEYPSVTTILGIIDKSGPLMHWAANMERRALETALLDVLVSDGAKNPEYVLGELAKKLTGAKAFLKEQEQAATIGTAAHAWIEWETHRRLGEKVGDEPIVPDAAAWAVEAWKDWAKAVDFTPLMAERPVYCPLCGYAGTIDFVAKVSGRVTLGDYKTGKAIYAESFLQNIAYQHALACCERVDVEQGLIVRLPKVTTDPAFETMVVPDTLALQDFLAAYRLWRWRRRMEGKKTGRRSAA